MRHHHCFAVCTPGLERLVATELGALGVRRSRTTAGGVTFDASTRQLYVANVWSRVATRILVRVAAFTARDFATLERRAGEIDWSAHLDLDRPVRLRVTSARSRLYHTAAIEQRVRTALGRPVEGRDATTTDQLVVVRVVRDEVTISVDTSGAPLHRRGWRTDGAKAPLRETLAAALVLACGWDPSSALVDPFCGSGTIPIEAATFAAGLAPGAGRRFAFEDAPGFEPGTYASVRAGVQPQPLATSPSVILACDRDAGAIETTLANAARAGVEHLVTARRASVSDLGEATPPDTGWLLSNPPYGKRVSAGNDLRNLFARFGDVARASFAGWQVGLLVADTRVVGHARLSLTERFRTSNGGIPVQFLTGAVSARRAP